MEDILRPLGNISNLPESSLEICSEIIAPVYHIHSNHVNIMSMDHYLIVLPLAILPLAVLVYVIHHMEPSMRMINTSFHPAIAYQVMLNLSKLKSLPMDLSKLHSPYMLISLHISQEFTPTLLELSWEDMPSRC